MEEIHGASEEAGASPEETTEPSVGRQMMLAIAAGAAALTIVMLLMLSAARRGSLPDAIEPVSTSKDIAPKAYERYVVVDRCAMRDGSGAAGAHEVIIEGSVANTGALTVAAADLRCFFPTHSGGQTSMDLPLVVDTKLEDVGAGALGPYSTRDFSVRVGEFPGALLPEILRVEVVNVRLGGR
jgi:hypothetical protein